MSVLWVIIVGKMEILEYPLEDYAVTKEGKVWSFRTEQWLSEFMVNGRRAVTMTVEGKRYTRLVDVLIRSIHE